MALPTSMAQWIFSIFTWPVSTSTVTSAAWAV
jgi:hypothetical protein